MHCEWRGDPHGESDYADYASIPLANLHERSCPELPVVARYPWDVDVILSRKLYDLGWSQISVDSSSSPGAFQLEGNETVCCFLKWHGLINS